MGDITARSLGDLAASIWFAASAPPIDNGKISSYSVGMRRKPGTLIPIEEHILAAGLALRQRGTPHFHGFLIAKEIREGIDARRLTAQGVLYKALDRMARAGLLERWWEDPDVAAREQRPRRRLYQVTGLGEQALAAAVRARPASTPLRTVWEGE
ncbi:MAG: PadR family transcriptional regulator [Chloroflexota bacterium]|nr:PadR family transcriptional regulator [Chloroflexota bacterium]